MDGKITLFLLVFSSPTEARLPCKGKITKPGEGNTEFSPGFVIFRLFRSLASFRLLPMEMVWFRFFPGNYFYDFFYLFTGGSQPCL